MKRLLAFLICLALCASLLPAASAEGAVCLTAEEADGCVKLTLSATVDLANFQGMHLLFTAPEGFAFSSCEPHPLLKRGEINKPELDVEILARKAGACISAGEPILTLYLSIPEDLPSGSHTMRVEILEAFDWNFEDYGIRYQSAETAYYKPFPPPTITKQPAPATLAVGETARFMVKAASELPLSYQWQYRKSSTGTWYNSASTGNRTATLSVPVTAARDGFEFRCRVKNADGTVYSRSVSLTVLTVPAITKQPMSLTQFEGKTASFFVAATGGALSYQWQYRSSPTGSWYNSASEGNGTSTLSVPATAARNGFEFRCRVKNSLGTVYTDTVSLTVVTKPTVSAQPQNVTAIEGTTAKFTVTASGATSYQWQYRKSPTGSWYVSGSEGSGTATLSVPATAARDSFEFRCRLMNAAGTVYTDAASLTVVTKPVITAQPTSRTVNEGSTAKFTVTATGTGLSYQWQYRKSPTGSWYNSGSTGNGTATLSVPATAARNGFEYRCRITNAAGTVYTDVVTLTVK